MPVGALITRCFGGVVFGCVLSLHVVQVDAFSNPFQPAARKTVGSISFAKRSSRANFQSWLPRETYYEDDIFAVDENRGELEQNAIEYMALLLQKRLAQLRERDGGSTRTAVEQESFDDNNCNGNFLTELTGGSGAIEDPEKVASTFPRVGVPNERIRAMTKGRFRDLACSLEGEHALETLFDIPTHGYPENEDVARGAVMALQSLLIMGMQVGVKGSPQQHQKMRQHLYRSEDDNLQSNQAQNDTWDAECIRKFKYNADQTAGFQLLAALKRKRTTQGAFDLLVHIGAWKKHENVALLRSGFPVRFTEEELQAAEEAEFVSHDPDEVLGLRRDLRNLKVFTIDNASTDEIDDGLSVESITKPDGTTKSRIWVHIADADRWAPRSSSVFEAARRRSTSLYLPSGSISMFPKNLCTGPMSLKAGCDSCALSLGVELNADGSIDDSSIVVTPSLIRVSYGLTYVETDEMLDMGVGYFEEWELGVLLAKAKERRKFRIGRGSSEGMVPTPIPQASIKVAPDSEADDNFKISAEVEVSHNAGLNITTSAGNKATETNYAAPVSQAFLLVTEMMILAGEAIGKWKHRNDLQVSIDVNVNASQQLNNKLELPFRSQQQPDYSSKYEEVKTMESLKVSNRGGGYCHAWYARRFFKKVQVTQEYKGHAGLGLDCYVQWSSPIRRFSDLQVHAAIKRFLRREKVNALIRNGSPIPHELSESDLGCAVPREVESSRTESGAFREYILKKNSSFDEIDFTDGQALANASRPLQRKCEEYWMFEHIRRLTANRQEEVVFETLVLGCVDPDRYQYAIYVYQLGLEHRYLSELGSLSIGETLWLKVTSTSPRNGLLTFTLASRGSGIAFLPAPAA